MCLIFICIRAGSGTIWHIDRKVTMVDSGRHILPALKKMCTSFFVQTVHVQNPPIVYKCVHTLFVHLYMYKILRSYTNVYMHYLYICTCTKSSDRIQMCTCIICTFVHVQKGKSRKCSHGTYLNMWYWFKYRTYKCIQYYLVHPFRAFCGILLNLHLTDIRKW